MIVEEARNEKGQLVRLSTRIPCANYDGMKDVTASSGWVEYADFPNTSGGAGYRWHTIGKENDVRPVAGSKETEPNTINVYIMPGNQTQVKILGIKPDQEKLAREAFERVMMCLAPNAA